MSDVQNTTETPVETHTTNASPTEAPVPEAIAAEAPVTATEPAAAAPEDEAPSTEFAAALAAHDAAAPAAAERATNTVKKGQKVKARVVSVSDTTLVFDIGARSEATADAAAFKDDTGAFTVAVDEIVDLFVLDAGDSITLGKSTRATGEANAKLQALREANKNGVPVTGRVTAVNTGGLVVDVNGVRAFCPISQIENGFCADASAHVGKTYEFMVTKVGESKRDVVVSRREILKKSEKEAAKKMLANLKEGDQLEGRVVKAEGFGVFVDLGGVQGMIHVSELAHGRVGHPSEVVREGERVKVQVLRVEGGEGSKRRIALSMKAMLPDPWTSVAEQFVVGSKVQGKVTRLADFGAFVQLAPGVEGLVHVSESALTRVAHVKDVMKSGDTIEVQVLGVDPAKRRVSLSVRQALGGAPAEPRAAREPRGEGGENRPRRGAPGGEGRGRRDGHGGGGGGRREGGRREGGREREDFTKYSSGDTGPSETPMAIALRKAMEEARRKGQIQ